MVDFVTFLVGNYSYIISLGLSGLIILTTLLFYRRYGNNGFFLIAIGEILSAIWGFSILVFGQGAFLSQNLTEAGVPHGEISIILLIISLIGSVIQIIRVLAMLIGLFIISDDLAPRNTYSSG